MASGRSRLPDFLVLGQERWDEVERRNQLLIRELARRNPAARFLFAEQPLRPREVRFWQVPQTRRAEENVWVVRPIRPLPDAVSRSVADAVEAAEIRWAARRAKLRNPMIWTQDPRAATLLRYLPNSGLVYDLTDNWAAFQSEPFRRKEVEGRVRSLVETAEVVFACSRSLERDASILRRDVRLLPNAVDNPKQTPVSPLPDVEVLPRPRLGYVGTLHESRLDVDLLAAAAKLRAHWSYALIGPNLLGEEATRVLSALPNVHLLGTKPHSLVHSYIAALDICLIPHLLTEFTRSLDPLKLYEYLAAGRPVIATDAGIPSELVGEVQVIDGPRALIACAEYLISSDDTEAQARRRAAVASDTWSQRAQSVEQKLQIERSVGEPGLVSAVIVNFNTCALLRGCLQALASQVAVREMQVVVIDNGSTDGSAEMVRREFPAADLIALGDNRGFAAACNMGSEVCRGEFILLVNSDAFVGQDCVRKLVDATRRHPEAAVFGPRLLNADASLQRSAWPFPAGGRLLLEAVGAHRVLAPLRIMEDLRTWPHDTERTVDFLSGACLLIRRSTLEAAGGFDESFHFYGEEADLQRRFRAMGETTVLVPGAEATHLGGASPAPSNRRRRLFYEAQLRFVHKHGGAVGLVSARVALLVGALLRLRWATARLAFLSLDTPREGVGT